MPAGFTGKAGIVREADLFSRLWPSVSAEAVTQLLPLLSETVNAVNDQESIVTKDGSSMADKTATGTYRSQAITSGGSFFVESNKMGTKRGKYVTAPIPRIVIKIAF